MPNRTAAVGSRVLPSEQLSGDRATSGVASANWGPSLNHVDGRSQTSRCVSSIPPLPL